MRPTLRDLQIGDKFYPASRQLQKSPIYEVIGKLEFNPGHGSATRKCKNLQTKEIESKSGRLEVIKIHQCMECGAKVSEGNSYCGACILAHDNDPF
jgi:hypothetical protein